MADFSWNLESNDAREGDVDPTDAPSAQSFPSRRDLRQRTTAPVRKAGTRVVGSPRTRPAKSTRVIATGQQARRYKGRLLPKLASIGAMLGVGALLVATSLPATALRGGPAAAVEIAAATPAQVKTQSLAVNKTVTEPAPSRDAYTVVSLAQQIRVKYGNQSFAYTNDPLGTIQWPFPIPVPISSGFGPRTSPCSGCSSYHEGVDFTPGAGTPIGAIADGVVSQVSTTGAYGNHVMVDHVIKGQKVQSLYAHMLAGSIKVVVGQQVTVTEQLGLVGSTGESTGAHLHLEVHLDGTPVDPFAWLKANAN
ncbi:MAG: family peptidase [Microbacteriaceae bacterium]|nr:family peptidase [Microbacteriaceae bacterium]